MKRESFLRISFLNFKFFFFKFRFDSINKPRIELRSEGLMSAQKHFGGINLPVRLSAHLTQ